MAQNKWLLLSALCVITAAWSEARRSHRNGGGPQSELFIFREQCALKEESGPCKALKIRYFFNIDSGSCETFEYGGCGGNDNNFLSKEECEESCVVSEDKDPCQLREAPGPCRGLVSRYLFDPEIQDCRHFFYGGCFGNANNFRTMDQCRTRCLRPDPSQQTTLAPVVHKVVPETVHKVVHEPVHEVVHEAVPETVHKAVHEAVPETVHEPVPEVVHEAVPETVHEPVPEVVHEAVPETVHEPVPEVIHEAVPEAVTHGSRRMLPLETTARTAEQTMEANAEALVQINNKTRETFGKDAVMSSACSLTVETGSCDGAKRRFFFNSSSRRCQSFVFSGCGGNENNFPSRRACVRTCVRDHRRMTGEKMMIRIRKKNLDKIRVSI